MLTLIVILGCSQRQQIFIPAGNHDIKQDTLSVRVQYKDVVAANKITAEWLAMKDMLQLNQQELQLKEKQILNLSLALNHSLQIDTLNQEVIRKYEGIDSINTNAIKQLRKDLAKQKLKFIPTYIAIPIGCVLAFLLGYYVH